MYRNYLKTFSFKDEEDFLSNFKIEIPKNFNFVFDVIDKYALTDPEKIALLVCDDDSHKTYSFNELSILSKKVATVFVKNGIKKNDRVMLILKRNPFFWICFLALMRIGAIIIPATHLLTEEDIIFRIETAEISNIICLNSEPLVSNVHNAKSKTNSIKNIYSIGEQDGFIDLISEIKKTEIEDIKLTTKNDEIMLIYFTSGTTGMPKMVAHNYLYPLAHIVTAKYWHGLDENSIHLTLSDTGWAKAMWGKFFGQWLCGSTVVSYEHSILNGAKLAMIIERHKITSFCAPPTAIRVFLSAHIDKYRFNLKRITTAGEPLDEVLFNKIKDKLNLLPFECYGQTETVPITLNSVYSTPKIGSIGKLSPLYNVFLYGKDGEVSEGEGEICIRVDSSERIGIFKSYYKNEELTNKVFNENIYHTGDMARIDSDGYVYFIGRADGIIKSAGYRIGPFEVENEVLKHGAVLECKVTGIPHHLRGQIIKADIVLKEGFQPTDKLKKEIITFVKKNSAHYKAPKVIEFVESFDKTISGKIKRT